MNQEDFFIKGVKLANAALFRAVKMKLSPEEFEKQLRIAFQAGEKAEADRRELMEKLKAIGRPFPFPL